MPRTRLVRGILLLVALLVVVGSGYYVWVSFAEIEKVIPIWVSLAGCFLAVWNTLDARLPLSAVVLKQLYFNSVHTAGNSFIVNLGGILYNGGGSQGYLRVSDIRAVDGEATSRLDRVFRQHRLRDLWARANQCQLPQNDSEFFVLPHNSKPLNIRVNVPFDPTLILIKVSYDGRQSRKILSIPQALQEETTPCDD